MNPRRSRTAILLLVVLSLIVFAVFAYSLRSGFAYDSFEEILCWDFIHDPANLLTALTFRVMEMDVLDFNRPVAVTSFMLDSLLWGKEPFGYHLTNNLLHVLAACLVFLLIRHILLQCNSSRDPDWSSLSAFLATLVFALHPVVTEAVCEPANRKDILAAVFGLGALLLAIRHDPKTGHGDILRIFLCTLLCLLSMGSKEAGIAFPVILLLYWFLFRRGEPGTFWAWSIAGGATASAAFLFARFALEHRPSEIFLEPPVYPGGSFGQALLIQPRILALYAFNLSWPLYLCADYNDYSVRNFTLPLSLFLLTLITAPLGFAIASLLPVCNLVPIYHPVADRYLYLPLVGLVLLVAVFLDSRLVRAKASRRYVAAVIVVIIVAMLIPITWQREKVWSTEISLWQDTLERNPRSMSARVDLPEALLRAGRVEEAKQQSEATLQTPCVANPWVWVDYAIELERLGNHAAAMQAAKRAITLKPDVIDALKMVRTLQCPQEIATEFSHISVLLPTSKQ